MLLLNTSSVVDDFRMQYFQVNSIEKADHFMAKLQQDSSPEAIGYVAALHFIKSRLYKFPLKKMKYFNMGKSALEALIKEHPYNIELRYIRYTLQKKVPKFLAYNTHISEDLSMIKTALPQSGMPTKIKSLILRNILGLNEMTKKDKNEFENLLINL